MNETIPDKPDRRPAGPAGRRAVWSRRIAIAVLALFGMFLLWNVVVVLLLAARSVIEGHGAPL